MFRSKKDVDTHVRDVFSKCSSENERLQHCFGIAKQYTSIKEFDSARRYLETFLGANSNSAEGHKLMGDIQYELGDGERALESFKTSYSIGKTRESLNRVCDLLARGYGNQDTSESKKKWFDLQKSSVANNSFNASLTSNPNASPNLAYKRTPINSGPPKTGFTQSPFTNGNASPLMTFSKTNGGNVDLQLRYLERRFDDGLGKILDQNTLVLDQMSKLKDEIKDISEKMDHIAVTQEKLETDLKDIQQKQKSTPASPYQFPQQNMMPPAPAPCRKCESVQDEMKAAQIASKSAAELASLKEQMERLEKLTLKAMENFSKQVPAPVPVPVVPVPVDVKAQVQPQPQIPAMVPLQPQIPAMVPMQPQVPAMVQPQSQIPAMVQPQQTLQSTPLEVKFDQPIWKLPGSEIKPLQPEVNKPVSALETLSSIAAAVPPIATIKTENILPATWTPAPNPTFSFGFTPTTTVPTLTTATKKVEESPKKVDDTATASPFTPLNLAGKFSFSDLAKNNNNSNFTFGGGSSNASFSGAGTQLFNTSGNANSSVTVSKSNTSANAEDEDDFVPTAEFQPVIPLPPLVEVKKGDENENLIVEYRAKVYRFAETKEWKERGVGNIKLLQSKDDPSKCRVVMWREKIGKLACNFSLFPDMKIENYQANPKVLFWRCHDFAEEPQWETFTVRFGNEENCKHFKDEMMRLVKITQTSSSPSADQGQAVSNSTPAGECKVDGKTADLNEKPSSTVPVPLSEMFKKPEGSWNCEACYCCNGKDLSRCVACQTVRPGFENTQPENTAAPPPTTLPTFTFGFPTSNSNTSISMFAPTTTTTTPTLINATNKIEETPKKADDATTASPFTTLNLAGKFSFSDLAKNNNNSSFTFGGGSSNASFSGAGTQLFNTSGNAVVSKSNTSANAEDEDDFVPTAEFQPVIPLPPLVDVKKGDENENLIVEYRAKVYRFAETKEWKERGVGNIKLLQSKDDPSKCRVVMWREKIGKLACNFSLFPDMKIENYQANPKVLFWRCHDFAEEPQWETFTVRFGNEENCKHFKDEMMRLMKLTQVSSAPSAEQGEVVSNSTPAAESKVADKAAEQNEKPSSTVPVPLSLSEMFKKPEGSWNCEACYCTNGKDVTVCVACQTVRPGFENVQSENTAAPPPTVLPTFTFGFPTSNSNTSVSLFAPTTATAKVEETPKKVDDTATASPFTGLNLAGKFSFADLAKNNNNSSFTFGGGSTNPSFTGAGSQLFNSSGNTSVNNANTSANAEEEDDFVPTAEFQPVVPLPPLVDVKKGDENENLIVEYRAKVYRFAETKEWKERGVGNIKLLQSKDDPSKCRVVMWREKIGKLACNFSLFPGLKIENYQSNPKVLFWRCHDFAEEPQWETFTVRFGNEENCQHFKQKMLEYANSAPAAAPVEKSSATAEKTSSCPGCIGCDSDNFKMPGYANQTEEASIEIALNPDTSSILTEKVSLDMFDPRQSKIESKSNNNSFQIVPEFGGSGDNQESILHSKSEASSGNNTLSSFSFMMKTPEKTNDNNASPISFQLKTPTFSFGNSATGSANSSIFGGSIFSPPTTTSGGTVPAGLGTTGTTNPSPFVSPFAQQLALNNSTSSPTTTPFTFSLSNFQQAPVQQTTLKAANDDAEDGESREEDEYEDVDDEEDECMFEEDAHIYIQGEAESAESFADKGEGVIRVLYDGESYCARLVVLVDGEVITEHLVASDTALKSTGDLTHEWNGICTSESTSCTKSRIKAVFTNDDAYQGFSSVMQDGLEFAEQAGVTEAILMEESYQ